MTQVIKTVLEVDASKAVTGFGTAERAAAGYGKSLDKVGGRRNSVFDDVPPSAAKAQTALGRLSGSVRDNRAEWDGLSTRAMIGGAAIAGGLGLATKANIEWESSWAGVTKTVDGSQEQLDGLQEGLRGLAKELPATHTELAAVAEAAGQLGVARDDILGFTETAVALGESTNLSADEAATSLAKFSNVMGTAARDGVEGYERLGSALVALGNDGASTEADIMSMALRLSGAGKQIGASEADVLALANALSSVGIEAELGGGAMSRALLKMNSAVISGGDELEAFAEIAGVSAKEFATAWREDPIEATNLFVTGLGRIGDSGGDASAALDDVGLKGTQNAQVLLRAAGASDLMTESLELGATAWEENAALAEEAGKRYETDASKIQVSVNKAKDALISFGADVAPVLAGAAEGLAGIADWTGRLPAPVKTAATALAGVSAAGLLIGGATVKVIGFAQDVADALNKIGPAGTTADGGMTRANRSARGIAKWGGYALGATAVVTVLGQIVEAGRDAPASIEQVTAAILKLSDASSTANVDKLFTDLSEGYNFWTAGTEAEVDGLADAFDRLNNPGVTDHFNDLAGVIPFITKESDQLKGVFEGIGDSLAALPAEEAARKFDLMVETLGGGTSVTNKLLELMPAYRDHLTGAANDAKLAGDGADDFAGGLDEVDVAAQEAEGSLEDLVDAVRSAGDEFLTQTGAARDYEAALDDMRDGIKENGNAWDITTPKGRANREGMEAIAEAARDSAAAILANNGTVEQAQKVLDRGAKDVDSFADSMGLGAKATKGLKDEVLQLPADAVTDYETKGAEAAKKKAEDVKDAVIGIPEWKQTQISESGASESTKRVLGMDDAIFDLDGKQVSVGEVGADPSRRRVEEMDGAIFGLKGKKVEVSEFGATAAGERVVGYKGKIYAIPLTRETSFTAKTAAAIAAVNSLQALINGMSGRTVDVGLRSSGIDMGTARSQWAGGIVGAQPMAAGGLVGGYRKQLPGGSVAPGFYPTSDAGIWMAEDKRSKWESYIPERPDLRDRALAILGETANRFGRQVIPMAQGAVMQRSAPRDGRTYTATPRPPAPALTPTTGAGGNTYATAHIENLHGVTLETAMREVESVQRHAALSRRNTE